MSGGGILLATINAKWIHPSLALRLLKANLGPLENNCEIAEFALRQPMHEKINPILAACPEIIGFSVSIWNHGATLELLKELYKVWEQQSFIPVIVLGGPEVSYLPPEAEIFKFADYCICGEGETAFAALCNKIFKEISSDHFHAEKKVTKFIQGGTVDPSAIKTGYHLYTDEDLHNKLIYTEASRGCPYGCEFCLSAVQSNKIRYFPLEQFFADMDDLIARGVKTFKFLDRSFNCDTGRARRIMEYFIDKISEKAVSVQGDSVQEIPLVVHFEMVPSRFPPELLKTIARFPSGTLRLEIGIQTLNSAVSAFIGRPSDPEQELSTLRFLTEKTNAIIHADLIAGLPGEDIVSFGRGFDMLYEALRQNETGCFNYRRTEIQLGILKLLPGASISRHSSAFGMRYSEIPPYEVIGTAAMTAYDLDRIKNFARFWELLVSRGIWPVSREDIVQSQVFERFMSLSDSLFARFGKNWGIPRDDLLEAIHV